jgi:hypothetical protein
VFRLLPLSLTERCELDRGRSVPGEGEQWLDVASIRRPERGDVLGPDLARLDERVKLWLVLGF